VSAGLIENVFVHPRLIASGFSGPEGVVCSEFNDSLDLHGN